MSTSARDLVWTTKGTATLSAFSDERVVVRSTVPAAPGQPMTFSMTVGERVELRVRSCRREGDVFVIEGRPVSLTKAQKAALEAALAEPAAGLLPDC